MASSGNFATLNPLSGKGPTFSQGNCRADSTFYWATYYATIMLPKSGKWYAECVTPNIVGADASFPMGIQDARELSYLGNKTSNGNPQYIGMSTSTAGEGYSIYTHANGTYSKKYHNNSSSDTSLAKGANGDIYQIAVDLDNNKLWFGKNNTWDQSNPSSNGTATYSITNKNYVMGGSPSSSEHHIWNFGQDSTFGGAKSAGNNADGNGFGDFAYEPPTGFLAVCSANVLIDDDVDPAQTDDDFIGGKQFNAVEYTGNSTTGQSITGMNLKPDLLWCKMTSSSQNNQWYDSSRLNSRDTPFGLRSDTNGAEFDDQSTGNTNEIISSFDTDGFTLGGSGSGPNDSGRTYIAMGWRANGGVTSSNSDGSITSTVQANTKAGFSIVTFTSPNNTSDQTVGHGLNAAPDFIISKNRDSSFNWDTFCSEYSDTTTSLRLNTTDGPQSGRWGTVNSSIITTKNGNTHSGTDKFVFYVWHNVEGFQKFGTYPGAGDNDGTYIHLGFRPRFVLIKKANQASTTYGWPCFLDIVNDNINDQYFDNWWADQTVAASGNYPVNFLSNGFKHRNNNTNLDSSGNTYLYAAWGDVPFKYGNTF